jgi:hypothetical protein
MKHNDRKRSLADRRGFVAGIYSYEDFEMLAWAPGVVTSLRKRDLRDWVNALLRGRKSRNVHQR